jgi:hypothetical protein
LGFLQFLDGRHVKEIGYNRARKGLKSKR